MKTVIYKFVRNNKLVEMIKENSKYAILINGYQFTHKFPNKQNCESVFFGLQSSHAHLFGSYDMTLFKKEAHHCAGLIQQYGL